jgi:hypothetical protein
MNRRNEPQIKALKTERVALVRTVKELTAVRDLLLQTLDENVRSTMFAKACRGSFDRAALKCLIASQREVLTALESLVRGSET